MTNIKKLIFFLVMSAAVQGSAIDHTVFQGKIISKISLVGNKKTKNEVILRELHLKEGLPYDSTSYKLDHQRLQNLQLFTRSDIEAINNRDRLIIKITVYERWYFLPKIVLERRERDWKKWSYGAGVAHTNVAGRNVKLFCEGWAGFNPGFLVEYDNPWFAGNLKLNTLVDVYYGKFKSKHLDIERFYEDHQGVTVSVGKRWKNTTFLYLYGGIDNIDYPIEFQYLLEEPETVNYSSLGLAFRYDTRDLYAYPRSGVRFESYTARVVTQHIDYFAYGVDARYYKRIVDDFSIGFRASADLSDKRLPVYSKKYLGYMERIRGEYYSRLSGDNRFMCSVEMKIPILASRYINLMDRRSFWADYFRNLPIGISSAIFVDYGRIWNNGTTFADAESQTGFGGGLHLLLPYSAVLRLEYAMDLKFNDQIIVDLGVAF